MHATYAEAPPADALPSSGATCREHMAYMGGSVVSVDLNITCTAVTTKTGAAKSYKYPHDDAPDFATAVMQSFDPEQEDAAEYAVQSKPRGRKPGAQKAKSKAAAPKPKAKGKAKAKARATSEASGGKAAKAKGKPKATPQPSIPVESEDEEMAAEAAGAESKQLDPLAAGLAAAAAVVKACGVAKAKAKAKAQAEQQLEAVTEGPTTVAEPKGKAKAKPQPQQQLSALAEGPTTVAEPKGKAKAKPQPKQQLEAVTEGLTTVAKPKGKAKAKPQPQQQLAALAEGPTTVAEPKGKAEAKPQPQQQLSALAEGPTTVAEPKGKAKATPQPKQQLEAVTEGPTTVAKPKGKAKAKAKAKPQANQQLEAMTEGQPAETSAASTKRGTKRNADTAHGDVATSQDSQWLQDLMDDPTKELPHLAGLGETYTPPSWVTVNNVYSLVYRAYTKHAGVEAARKAGKFATRVWRAYNVVVSQMLAGHSFSAQRQKPRGPRANKRAKTNDDGEAAAEEPGKDETMEANDSMRGEEIAQ